MRGCVRELLLKVPTAHISVAERAVRELRLLPVPTVGLLTRDHCFPFQCSMRAELPKLPTAHTLVAEIALIAFKELPGPGFGLATMCHVGALLEACVETLPKCSQLTPPTVTRRSREKMVKV